MRKSIILAGLVVMTANVFGMNSNRVNNEPSNSSVFLRTVPGERVLRQNHPEKLSNIDSFLISLKRDGIYSRSLIKEALVYYCNHQEFSGYEVADRFGINGGSFYDYIVRARVSRSRKYTEEEIDAAMVARKEMGSDKLASEKVKMSANTISRHAKIRGESSHRQLVDKNEILEWYKSDDDGELCKDINELYGFVLGDKCNVRKAFYEAISEQLSTEEKRRIVENNRDILNDFRKRLLSEKERLDKYKDRYIQVGSLCHRKFGLCEDYLIRNISAQLGENLGLISTERKVKYTSTTQLTEDLELQIVETFNKNKEMTYRRIADNFDATQSVIQSVIKKYRRRGQVTARKAIQNSYKTVNISDSGAKRKLEEFGYTESVSKKMRGVKNQYSKLNYEQRGKFKEILDTPKADRQMPSDADLELMAGSDSMVNKKFRNCLLILCGRENAIESERLSEINRDLNIWEKCARSQNQALYQSSQQTVTELQRSKEAWSKLTHGQRELFKRVFNTPKSDRRMPSDRRLESVMAENDSGTESMNVNKTFRQVLLLLCGEELGKSRGTYRNVKTRAKVWAKIIREKEQNNRIN